MAFRICGLLCRMYGRARAGLGYMGNLVMAMVLLVSMGGQVWGSWVGRVFWRV
jgi:hypothetical protein